MRFAPAADGKDARRWVSPRTTTPAVPTLYLEGMAPCRRERRKPRQPGLRRQHSSLAAPVCRWAVGVGTHQGRMHTFPHATLTADESTRGTHTHLRNSPQNGKAPNISRTPAEIQRYSACWLVESNSRVLYPIHERSSPAEERRKSVMGCWRFTTRAWGKHAEPTRANANQRVLACRIDSTSKVPCDVAAFLQNRACHPACHELWQASLSHIVCDRSESTHLRALQ